MPRNNKHTKDNGLDSSTNQALDTWMSNQKDALDKQYVAEIKHLNQTIKLTKDLNEARRKAAAEQVQRLKDLEKERDTIGDIIKEKRSELDYQRGSLSTKKELLSKNIEELKILKMAYEVEQRRETDEKKRQAAKDKAEALQSKINKDQEQYNKINKAMQEAELKGVSLLQKKAVLEERSKKYLEEKKALQQQYQAAMTAAENDEERKNIEQQYQTDLTNLATSTGNPIAMAIAAVVDAVSAAATVVANATKKATDKAVGVFSENMPKIDTRLQGINLNFEQINSTANKAFSASPYVSQKKYIENVTALVEQGVAYNIEQRAFMASISDRIAGTFDALDKNLARLIRLQQADVTYAQLGAESHLTTFLNRSFQDTSYLSDMYDNVSAILLDATAAMTRDAAVQFGYTAQKWLGSLYSLGASENLVSAIAQGLGYLGTGNVTALSGNQGLQNLFAMGSARAGLSYSDLLTGGLNMTTTNALMKSMVEYLKEIAESGNQVVKSQISNVFGVSNFSDLRAVTNLSPEDIAMISSYNINYDMATRVTENAILNDVAARTHLSTQIDNLLENLMYTVGSKIAESDLAYGLYRAGGLVSDITSNMGILGKGVGVVSDLLTAGTGLWSFVTALSDFAGSGRNTGGFLGFGGMSNAYPVAGLEFTSRGEGFTGLNNSGVLTGISKSGQVVSTIMNPSGYSDYSMLQRASAVSASAANITSGGAVTFRDISDIYSELFEKQSAPIKVNLVSIADEAAEKLDSTLLTRSTNEELKSIRSRLDEEFDVDVRTDDVSAITSAISSIRVW